MKSFNQKKVLRSSLLAIFLLLFGLTNINCQGTGQPRSVDIAFTSYTTAWHKLQEKFIDLLIPRANASVTSLKMCFKRLRFKLDDTDSSDPATDEDNVDFDLGEITIDPAGTHLDTVVIPEGTYKRIEFDLENHCASGNSINLANTSGSYTTGDRITIKFQGSFTADSDGILNLGVQNILSTLNSYSGTGTLKDAVENASGILAD